MVTNFTCLAPTYDHKITRQKTFSHDSLIAILESTDRVP